MNWKGLLIPVVSVATFLGCAASIYLIQISVKSFRKKTVFSLLLIQMSIMSLLYLIPQFVLVVLFLLDIWIVSPEVEVVGAAYCKYLPRINLLVLPFFLQVEMYVSVRKRRLHTKLNTTRVAVLLNTMVMVGLALLTYILVLSGMLKTYFFPSESHSLVTPILELSIAIVGLSIAMFLLFGRTSRHAYVTGARPTKVCFGIVSRFCALIFIAFIAVGILRISITAGHNVLMPAGCNILECIILLTDTCFLALAPFILLRKSEAFKKLNGLVENACVIPKATFINAQPTIQGTLMPRDHLKRNISFRQMVPQKFKESPCSKRLSVNTRVRKTSVRRFSYCNSTDSFTMFPAKRNSLSESVLDSNSIASRSSVRRMMPQFKDIPEVATISPLWTSVRIPGMVCSSIESSSPLTFDLNSFTSADWDNNSSTITPKKRLDETIPLPTSFRFPSIDTCWLDISQQRFRRKSKPSTTYSDCVPTFQAASEQRLFDVSPELRMDYIHATVGRTISSGAVGNLPGLIPSPVRCPPRPRSVSDSSMFVVTTPCYSVQENSAIAMLFDS